MIRVPLLEEAVTGCHETVPFLAPSLGVWAKTCAPSVPIDFALGANAISALFFADSRAVTVTDAL